MEFLLGKKNQVEFPQKTIKIRWKESRKTIEHATFLICIYIIIYIRNPNFK